MRTRRTPGIWWGSKATADLSLKPQRIMRSFHASRSPSVPPKALVATFRRMVSLRFGGAEGPPERPRFGTRAHRPQFGRGGPALRNSIHPRRAAGYFKTPLRITLNIAIGNGVEDLKITYVISVSFRRSQGARENARYRSDTTNVIGRNEQIEIAIHD